MPLRPHAGLSAVATALVETPPRVTTAAAVTIAVTRGIACSSNSPGGTDTAVIEVNHRRGSAAAVRVR
ncbi:hypothetical protein MCNF_50020 [Mycolicibacterium confluentis]|uniref:Uncharacterized protein n=1 Tax=Mycolicibacterium confluentis TaxID=28047 RepID=A0A7I7Y3Z8_9MYCO|nr:hypothetical protein MCNF_50020 [Mycolicibacterium confluentis]